MKDEEISRMVKDCFTQTARHEWRRLKQDAYHQIEFAVTMYFLTKYLPENGLILDAGGGPGRYTIELAKRKTSWKLATMFRVFMGKALLHHIGFCQRSFVSSLKFKALKC